jgi:hypothetical protein
MRHFPAPLTLCLLGGSVLALTCLAADPVKDTPQTPATNPAGAPGANPGAGAEWIDPADWKAPLDYVASCKKLAEQIKALPDWVESMK